MRSLAALLLALGFPAVAATYAPVEPGRTLAFPADHGAHPQHRIEWWYVTGHLEDGSTQPIGFQVTFFRLRNAEADDSHSRFAPKQLLMAHAAVADPARGALLHDQRAAREGFGLAGALVGDAAVHIDRWRLAREGGDWVAEIPADNFALQLRMTPAEPLLLQGERGFSRKGPQARHASYYYSQPQLAVTARLAVEGKVRELKGRAWLDHEWSSELLPQGAVGWDWIGANLAGGGALMAFRLRDAGGASLWSSALIREKDGRVRSFAPAEVAFRTLRRWRSPRTGAEYPVAVAIRLGESEWQVEPWMPDQELDSRASTGTVYWEGAVSVTGPGGRKGAGYLELTGYAGALRF
jgi:predicted secreted hydrolase